MQAAANESALAAGTILAGKYEIRRRLGSGGMGAVYEARHVRMNKRVAVKVIHPQFAQNGEAVGRFLREAEAAARIRHPNVIDVVDVDERHDPPFMVLEFLEGQSLATILERERALSVGRCAALMLPVLGAVSAAHENGIVHRDLKPENIFVASAGDETIRPVVLDFGVAKIDASAIQGLTQTNTMVGTVVYMSPEQARDSKRVDPRSDQYTLGVILYECLSGVRPCDGDSLYLVLNAIVEGRYRPLRELVPGLPPALDAIVSRAMAKDPAERFDSVRAMANELAPFAKGQSFSFASASVAPEFAFGSTMSADDVKDSAVAAAVHAVVGARPGELSADDHAARVSGALAGPTVTAPSEPRATQSPEKSLSEVKLQPARTPAASTLGGSSIELPSPVERSETVGIDPRGRGARSSLWLAVAVGALAVAGGLAAMFRGATPGHAANAQPVLSPSVATPPIARALPVEPARPSLEPPARVPDPALVDAEAPPVNAVVPAQNATNPRANTRTTPRGQTPSAPTRPGANTTPVLTSPPETRPEPTTRPTTPDRPATPPTEGPRQVGGGFVL
jgi:serine/threonine protein kinase